MKELARKYMSALARLLGEIQVSDGAGAGMETDEGIACAARLCLSVGERGGKLMFVGNGASAAISSHMATDFWKNGGIKAVSFNDSAGLTCIGNDYGYRHVFEKPVVMFADAGDLLVAISSSGASENILLAVDAATARGCAVLTMSGFRPDNPLRRMGALNFYVPAGEYGPVEVLHQGLCHCILDIILHSRGLAPGVK